MLHCVRYVFQLAVLLSIMAIRGASKQYCVGIRAHNAEYRSRLLAEDGRYRPILIADMNGYRANIVSGHALRMNAPSTD